MIYQKGQINDLALDLKSKDKAVENLNDKVKQLLDEISSLKRVAQADEATRLRIELKAAQEKIKEV